MQYIKTNVQTILYFFFFGILFAAKGIGLYDGQTIFKCIVVIASTSLLMKVSLERYNRVEILYIGISLTIAGISYMNSGDKGLLLYILLMIGMKNINIEKLLQFALIVWAAAFGSIWFISLMHMESTEYRVANKLGMEHIFRWSMGYAHPNVLHISYLILVALVLLVLQENITWRHYLGLILGNILVFLFSVSYTGAAICFLLLIGRGYMQIRHHITIIERILIGVVFPCYIIVSVLGPIMLKGKVFDIVNKILNTRLYLAKHYLTKEYVSLFGVKISDITTSHWTMDNSYVYALIAYGVIIFLSICILLEWLILSYLKQGKMTEIIVILTLLGAGLTEPFLFNASFKNIVFIFLGGLIYEKLQCRGEEKISIFKIKNIEIYIPVFDVRSRIYKIKETLASKKEWIILGGCLGGILALLWWNIYGRMPEGFVTERDRCEDISENITVYDGKNREYQNYKAMKEFMEGEEIEYFAGDIIRMETARWKMIYGIAGTGCGAAIAGSIAMIVKRKKNK